MSRNLNEIVLQSLRDARAAFFAGDEDKYQNHMQAAQNYITEIESLDMPLDGSSGRAMAVLGLRGEYALQAALPLLHNPEQAMVQYEIAAVSLVSIFKSKVISRDDPWLPNPSDILGFFGEKPHGSPFLTDSEADTFADTLDKAARVYAGLTGGGGGGVANLYRAEIAARRGDWAMAERLACKAQEEMTGDRWMEPIITKLTKN